MELSTELKIKQEIVEPFESEGDPNYFIDIACDIKSEIDIEFDPLFGDSTEFDWCVDDSYNDALKNLVENYYELLKTEKCECQYCRNIFTNRYQLLKHYKYHLSIKLPKLALFQCDYCSKYFTLRRKIISHIKKNHTKRRRGITKRLHQCHICTKVLTYRSWHSHIREVHSQTVYKCEICGSVLKGPRTLKRHVLFVHQGLQRCNRSEPWTNVQCSLCPAILGDKNALKTHIRNCHSDKEYKCDLCKVVVRSRPYLFSHLRRRHAWDVDSFKCNECYKEFKWLQMLNIHKTMNHKS